LLSLKKKVLLNNFGKIQKLVWHPHFQLGTLGNHPAYSPLRTSWLYQTNMHKNWTCLITSGTNRCWYKFLISNFINIWSEYFHGWNMWTDQTSFPLCINFVCFMWRMHGNHGCFEFLFITKITLTKVIFWVVVPCGLVDRYHCFREIHCLHLQASLHPWRWLCYFEMLVSTYESTWCYYPEDQQWHLHHRENLNSHINQNCFVSKWPIIL
jgi:hypothetical protein